jgi:folate-binding protein YgfZ
MMPAAYTELTDTAVISFSGEDAVAFLHAPLTSDVAGLGVSHTQYSGYCTPKGRLLATLLLWRRASEILALVPAEIADAVRARLSKYVLRARGRGETATARHALFGVCGEGAAEALADLTDRIPASDHEISQSEGLELARLPVGRFLVLAPPAGASRVRDVLARSATPSAAAWASGDIEAGVAVIAAQTQEEYVPQMVNLDLLGGVSYSKGCYPGQEIVARTHYLGKLKQRLYRVRAAGDVPLRTGARLYSTVFGPDQASGAVVSAVDSGAASGGLAVLQRSALEHGPLRLGALDGPAIELLPLPYAIPD